YSPPYSPPKTKSKSSILANKKKMSNVLSMWMQRSHESQAPLVALDGNSLALTEERSNPTRSPTKGKLVKDNTALVVYVTTPIQPDSLDAQDIPRHAANISGGYLGGVIRMAEHYDMVGMVRVMSIGSCYGVLCIQTMVAGKLVDFCLTKKLLVAARHYYNLDEVMIANGLMSEATFIHKGFNETRWLGLQSETEQLVHHASPLSEIEMLVVDSVVPGGPAYKNLDPCDVFFT
nr:DegP protease 7 [Tanacetum cinerariifolium]